MPAAMLYVLERYVEAMSHHFLCALFLICRTSALYCGHVDTTERGAVPPSYRYGDVLYIGWCTAGSVRCTCIRLFQDLRRGNSMLPRP
jgi:hypothetical protein